MNYKAVIFDMDGVLVNSEPHYARIEKENFKLLGLEIPEEEHRSFQGAATDHMWRALKKKYRIKESLEKLVMMTNQIAFPWFESLETIETMPGVEKLIRFIHDRKIPLALASSSYPDVIEVVLSKTGFKKYFDVVVNSTMAGKSKPSPDIFLLAAERLKVEPAYCLVIEDSANGIRAAKDAGMYCIAFAGPGSEHQDQSNADMVVNNYSEVPILLQEP